MVLLVYVHPKRRLLCEKTLYVCSFLEQPVEKVQRKLGFFVCKR